MVRKECAQPVQQACICLCASIIHKDERRAIDMTDLFSVWNEEKVFWETLNVMILAFPSNYQWIESFLQEYRQSWDWTKDCSVYFIESGRSVMFSAILLFIRGPPQRDTGDPVLSPADISYAKDYAEWFYGRRTPSYSSLKFLNKYEKEPEFHESKSRITTILSSCFQESSVEEHEETSEIVNTLTQLIRKMVEEFPGHPSSGTEPYAVKVRGGGIKTSSSTISLSGSAIRTGVSSIRGMSVSHSLGNGASGARRRIGKANREVCVNEYAVDWSTKRGRQMGREVNHAFRVSEVVSRRSMILNEYYDSVEMMLMKQCRKAFKAKKEMERLKRMQNHGKRQRRFREIRDRTSSSEEEEYNDTVTSLPLFFENVHDQ